jgi:Branched-chain amino acid transport system / permease component
LHARSSTETSSERVNEGGASSRALFRRQDASDSLFAEAPCSMIEHGLQFRGALALRNTTNISNPMSSPGKSSFSFWKFPERGLILLIVALGLLLAVFGGSVQSPKFQTTPDGKRERVFETNAAGQKVPAFETVNKFLNARTIVQIAKDTSFFAIMAVGVTPAIITGGTDLSIGSIYALASVCGALVLSPYGPSGGVIATVLGVLVTLGVGTLLGFLNGGVITAFNVHPFIITLGTMAVYRGIAFVQTGGQSIGGFPASFRQFVRWEIPPDLRLVPLIVMILVRDHRRDNAFADGDRKTALCCRWQRDCRPK